MIVWGGENCEKGDRESEWSQVRPRAGWGGKRPGEIAG